LTGHDGETGEYVGDYALVGWAGYVDRVVALVNRRIHGVVEDPFRE
jgi:hypothetical protein